MVLQSNADFHLLGFSHSAVSWLLSPVCNFSFLNKSMYTFPPWRGVGYIWRGTRKCRKVITARLHEISARGLKCIRLYNKQSNIIKQTNIPRNLRICHAPVLLEVLLIFPSTRFGNCCLNTSRSSEVEVPPTDGDVFLIPIISFVNI